VQHDLVFSPAWQPQAASRCTCRWVLGQQPAAGRPDSGGDPLNLATRVVHRLSLSLSSLWLLLGVTM
jgi:hypothetical protein